LLLVLVVDLLLSALHLPHHLLTHLVDHGADAALRTEHLLLGHHGRALEHIYVARLPQVLHHVRRHSLTRPILHQPIARLIPVHFREVGEELLHLVTEVLWDHAWLVASLRLNAIAVSTRVGCNAALAHVVHEL